MPSSLTTGFTRRFLNVFKTLTIEGATNGQLLVEDGATLRIVPRANPATCSTGQLNVAADNKLYLCTAANTWTVVGTQT